MRRAGLSLSLNFIVVALIALAVATLVLLAFSGQFGSVTDFIGGGIDGSNLDLAAESCLAEKNRLCDQPQYGDDSRQWAEDATFNGQSCEYWIQQGALGGNITTCSQSYGR